MGSVSYTHMSDYIKFTIKDATTGKVLRHGVSNTPQVAGEGEVLVSGTMEPLEIVAASPSVDGAGS